MNATKQPSSSDPSQRLLDKILTAKRAGQYVTMGTFAQEAIVLAERANSLAQLVRARFWLSDALRLQGRNSEACEIYIWLIGQAADPVSSRELSDFTSIWCLARAFVDLVACSQATPMINLSQLHAVLDQGLEWLSTTGDPGWAASLRMERGNLLRRQNKMDEARREKEAALALARRYPKTSSGYTLSDYQLSLAELLQEDEIGAYAEAAALAEEVLLSSDRAWDCYRANADLAEAYTDLGDTARALSYAEECLDAARAMESPKAMISAFTTLTYVYHEAGMAGEAAAAIFNRWLWIRRYTDERSLYSTFYWLSRVRLLQAKVALGLPVKEEEFPDTLPTGAKRDLARRYQDSARRFIARGAPLAQQWDESSGVDRAQERLRILSGEADKITALISI